MAYSTELAERVREYLRARASVTERKMFGGLTFLVNGNMCCGVLEQDLVIRVGPGNAGPFLRQPHIAPMDITGKPLDWMIRVAPDGYAASRAFNEWLKRALDYAQALPAKQPRPPKSRRTQRP